ncbi:MAG TPA: HRDC domain-containing protein [Streptosporangiaceae bacterium]|nr:HRDC domain-containing protein [Streptosporangiaceae bacterium]
MGGQQPQERAVEGQEAPREDQEAPPEGPAAGSQQPEPQLAAASPPAAGEDVVPLLEPRDGLPPLVVTDEALREAIRALGAGDGPVAVDAERASGFRYGHRAFLVQLRRRGAGTVLIDPVACPDLSDLDAALADTEAVLHAASQDLPCLADLGYRPQHLFDTELAGRLLGYPRVGLGPLVETVLGLALEKGYAAADWSTRPLPEDWLRYAALDVEVLVDLRDALAGQLKADGKEEWARQEFAAVLGAGPPPPRPDPWRRTSGIHRVRTRRGLAIVRELWLERDRIAQRRDLSPGRVLPDSAIVEAARAAPTTLAALAGVSGFKGRGARRHGQEWFAAIRRAHAQADQALPRPSGQVSEGPPPAHRWPERDPVAARRLAAVRTVVAALADEHSLPAENLVQPDVVRRLAWQPPDPVNAEAVAADLAAHGARPWQVRLTAVPIAGALLRLAEKGED